MKDRYSVPLVIHLSLFSEGQSCSQTFGVHTDLSSNPESNIRWQHRYIEDDLNIEPEILDSLFTQLDQQIFASAAGGLTGQGSIPLKDDETTVYYSYEVAQLLPGFTYTTDVGDVFTFDDNVWRYGVSAEDSDETFEADRFGTTLLPIELDAHAEQSVITLDDGSVAYPEARTIAGYNESLRDRVDSKLDDYLDHLDVDRSAQAPTLFY